MSLCLSHTRTGTHTQPTERGYKVVGLFKNLELLGASGQEKFLFAVKITPSEQQQWNNESI